MIQQESYLKINRFVTNSCSSSTGGLSGSSGYMEKIMNVPFYLYYNIKKENSFRHSLFYKLEFAIAFTLEKNSTNSCLANIFLLRM